MIKIINFFSQSKHLTDITTSVLYVAGQPALVTLDYLINTGSSEINEFRLSYYPHKLEIFSKILCEIFSKTSKHSIYGDFKSLSSDYTPQFYIHVMKKGK